MTCLEGLLFSKNYSCIWTNLNISGTLSFGHLKPKWRCLAIMHSAKLGKTKHISPNTLYQLLEGWWFFGFFFFLLPQGLGTCSHWVEHKLLCIPKYSWVKCEAICLNLSSQAHQQIYNKIAEREKNQDVALAQSKFRPQPD